METASVRSEFAPWRAETHKKMGVQQQKTTQLLPWSSNGNMKERTDWTGKLSFWDDFSVAIRSDLFPLVVDGRTAVSLCFWLRKVVHIIHYSYIYSYKTVPIMEYLYIYILPTRGEQCSKPAVNPQWTLQSQIYWLVSPQIIINRHLYVLSLYIYIYHFLYPHILIVETGETRTKSL